MTREDKSGCLVCKRQDFLTLMLCNIIQEAENSQVTLQEVYNFSEDISHSVVFACRVDIYAVCLELCTITQAGGILVREGSGSVLTNEGMVCDESHCITKGHLLFVIGLKID